MGSGITPCTFLGSGMRILDKKNGSYNEIKSYNPKIQIYRLAFMIVFYSFALAQIKLVYSLKNTNVCAITELYIYIL